MPNSGGTRDVIDRGELHQEAGREIEYPKRRAVVAPPGNTLATRTFYINFEQHRLRYGKRRSSAYINMTGRRLATTLSASTSIVFWLVQLSQVRGCGTFGKHLRTRIAFSSPAC